MQLKHPSSPLGISTRRLWIKAAAAIFHRDDPSLTKRQSIRLAIMLWPSGSCLLPADAIGHFHDALAEPLALLSTRSLMRASLGAARHRLAQEPAARLITSRVTSTSRLAALAVAVGDREAVKVSRAARLLSGIAVRPHAPSELAVALLMLREARRRAQCQQRETKRTAMAAIQESLRLLVRLAECRYRFRN